MNATEFMAALDTVEEDHELVLAKVKALKEAIAFLLDPDDPSPVRALGRLRELDQFFDTHFEAHMQGEETGLFPFLEQYNPEGTALVARLRQDHCDIRRMRAEFSNCLAFAGDLEDRLPRAVVRDLLAYGWDLWEAVDRHAHVETQAVHQCVTGSMADCEMPAGA